jgi:hypothetical protein
VDARAAHHLAATIVMGVVMTHAGLILALPRMYATLQFSFRLESFVLLGISGAMVAVLVMAQDAGSRLQRWTWLLVPVAAVSMIGAIQQTREHLQGYSRATALDSYATPLSEEFGQTDYIDYRLHVYEAPMPSVDFPRTTIFSSGHGSQLVRVPPKRLLATNIRSGPDFVDVTGAKIVGVDKRLDDVLEVAPSANRARASSATGAVARAGTVTISVRPAEHLAVTAGRAISLIALLVLAVELLSTCFRGVRPRGRGSVHNDSPRARSARSAGSQVRGR